MRDTQDRCDLCGGPLRAGTTTLEIWRGSELLVIKDVPADVCEQCTEAYISPDVSEQLDDLLGQSHEPERVLAVPEFSARQALGR